MTFVRNILRDLAEKRLWPVVAALVALLVAVPVFLGGRGDDGTAPAGPARAAAPAAQPADPAALVTAGESTVRVRARGGKLRNPFVQPAVKAAQSTTASTGASGDGTAAPSGGQPGGGTASGGDSGTSTAPPDTKPAPAQTEPDPLDVYRVDLRFGEAGRQRWIRDIARLTPLPSARNPFFVFLGVLKDGERAVFLISSDVQATGDGKCRPSHRSCQTIELQQGDTEFFDLMTPDGESVQYQMDLKSIRTVAAGATQARAAYARVSRRGQHVVRRATSRTRTAQVRGYHYLPQDGVLVRAQSAEAGTAAGPRHYRFGPGEVAAFRSRPAG